MDGLVKTLKTPPAPKKGEVEVIADKKDPEPVAKDLKTTVTVVDKRPLSVAKPAVTGMIDDKRGLGALLDSKR